MLDILKAIIYGIIEGITEWLPVSSTGHMLLAEPLLNFTVSPAFLEMFRVVIQLGAILAVVVIFFRRIFPFYPGLTRRERTGIWNLWGKIVISCVPAVIVGLLFDDKLDELFYNLPTVAAMLIVYGIAFIVIEKKNKRQPSVLTVGEISVRQAAEIGLFQLLALIPGTSRSGATIIGALLIGFSRPAAAEYTFFLGIPVMLGAGLLKLVKFGFHFSGTELAVLAAGFITAFVVSIFAIRFLTGFVKKHTFSGFGWYRIALGAVVLAVFFLS
ncbi:MAG: undecaprenyl-diphosphate phosphatase [Oscillospiraceae bacterium]|jgi:undecaprenyl-diphosphatase|nr:undecaprenyl-diphosphate phosphatase [Oscillospiraceae bacterium]